MKKRFGGHHRTLHAVRLQCLLDAGDDLLLLIASQ
jgi:hypothetical protein